MDFFSFCLFGENPSSISNIILRVCLSPSSAAIDSTRYNNLQQQQQMQQQQMQQQQMQQMQQMQQW